MTRRVAKSGLSVVPEELAELATKLPVIAQAVQKSFLVHMLGAKEVLAWAYLRGGYPKVTVAFRGDALKMQQYALQRTFKNVGSQLDRQIQTALGLPVRQLRWNERAYGVESPIGQRMSEGDEVALTEVLDSVAGAIAWLLTGDEGWDTFSVRVTLMPSEGEPWVSWPWGEGSMAELVYYNARTDRWREGQAPQGLISIPIRDGEGSAQALDFCQVLTPREPVSMGPVLRPFGRGPDDSYMVTHCTTLSKLQAGVSSLRDCGGFLFPSVAIAPTPSTPFGEVAFVLDPGVVLGALSPHRGRSRPYSHVYKTDVWTESTGTFWTNAAQVFFQQQTGNWDIGYAYEQSFYILGPTLRTTGGPQANDVEDPIIKTEAQLLQALRQRTRHYRRGMSDEQVTSASNQNYSTVNHYPYMEAKVTTIMPVSAIRHCFAPTFAVPEVLDAMRTIGYGGSVVGVEGEWHQRYGRLAEPWKYSWAVRDILINLLNS